jgi:hypothetical protein
LLTSLPVGNAADCTPSNGVVSLGFVKNVTHTNGTVAEIMSIFKNSGMMASVASEAAKHRATTASSSIVPTSTSKKQRPSGLPTFMMGPGPVMPTTTAKKQSASSNSTTITKSRPHFQTKTHSFKPTTLSTRTHSKPSQTAKPHATTVPARAPINIKSAKAKAAEFAFLMYQDTEIVYQYADPKTLTYLENAKRKVAMFDIAVHNLHNEDSYDFEFADSVARRVAWLLRPDCLAGLPHVEAIKHAGAEMMVLLGHEAPSTDVSM